MRIRRFSWRRVHLHTERERERGGDQFLSGSIKRLFNCPIKRDASRGSRPIVAQRFISLPRATASRFLLRGEKSIKAFITLRNALCERVLPRFFFSKRGILCVRRILIRVFGGANETAAVLRQLRSRINVDVVNFVIRPLAGAFTEGISFG